MYIHADKHAGYIHSYMQRHSWQSLRELFVIRETVCTCIHTYVHVTDESRVVSLHRGMLTVDGHM
jgi:hypothetical protein